MYDTPERVRRVEKRLLEGQRRKRRRSVYRLGALCAGYVLAGVAGFSAAVAITTQWIRFRKRTTHFTGEENEK